VVKSYSVPGRGLLPLAATGTRSVHLRSKPFQYPRSKSCHRSERAADPQFPAYDLSEEKVLQIA